MKSKDWGIEPRWEWEKFKKVIVFVIDDSLSDNKSSVIGYISKLIDEFKIPINVIDGNSEQADDLRFIKEIVSKSVENNRINYERFEDELREFRKKGKLEYGIVILINKEKYEFCSKPSQLNAIYGIGVDDGLVILRYTHREAVRHEFAHMLGLNRHHHPPKPECIMNYECSTYIFCIDCKNKVQKLWEEEIMEGKRIENRGQAKI